MPVPFLVMLAGVRAVGLMAAETSISVAGAPSATSNVECAIVEAHAARGVDGGRDVADMVDRPCQVATGRDVQYRIAPPVRREPAAAEGDAGGEALDDPLSTFTVPVTSQAPAALMPA